MAKAERPHAAPDIAHLELALRGAQSQLRRSRQMRSDEKGMVEVTLRGDFYPSRIRIKPLAGLSEAAADQLSDAFSAALALAVEATYEEQLDQFAPMLPFRGGAAQEVLDDMSDQEWATKEAVDPSSIESQEREPV